MYGVQECSMCGDVGLPQYLFKCLTCSHRYQHIYCSKFYPYRIEASMCNWCLPLEQLGPVTALEADDSQNIKASCNCIHYSNIITKPDIVPNPNRQIDHHAQKLAKHTKAFEYLLQVAEFYGRGHQWDHLSCPLEEADDCNIGKTSEKNYVGHHPHNQICRSQEMDHIGKLCNLEPASLLMHQIIISGCSEDQDRCFYTRRGHKMNSVKRLSTSSTQLPCHHSHAYTNHNRAEMQHCMGPSQIIKKNLNHDQSSHDQIMQKLNKQGLRHNQTIRKLSEQLDLRNVQQDPAIRLFKNHGMSCSDNDDYHLKCLEASNAKRARLQKQLQAAKGSSDRNIADQQMNSSQDNAYIGCSDDSDEQLEGKLGENMGATAKRPRPTQVNASNNYGLNSTNRQRAMNAGSNDRENIAADQDEQRVLCINQSSPARQHAVAWSRAAAGKRDHLLNSPSRAINRRYKLLADVLC